jgi:hypothetical protein
MKEKRRSRKGEEEVDGNNKITILLKLLQFRIIITIIYFVIWKD